MNQNELDRMIERGAAHGLLPRSVKSKAKRMGKTLPGRLVDNREAREHVEYLHAMGMSLYQIAKRAECAQSTLSEMLSGRRGTGEPHSGLNRENVIKAILAVELESYDTDRGARMPALGAHRRIRALVRVGYTAQFMSAYLGHGSSTRSYLGMFLRGQWTHQKMHDAVVEMYEKLRYADPLDYGVSKYGKGLSIARAKRNNWPGPDCWDDDMIDSPDAQPEWTGACGTMKGVRLHRKHSIMPLCEPCADAQREDMRRLREDYK